MSAPDLLSCPFCGCDEINEIVQDADTRWHECDWCRSTGPIEAPDGDPPQGWNHRANLIQPQPVAVEVQPLEWEASGYSDGPAAIAFCPWGAFLVGPREAFAQYTTAISDPHMLAAPYWIVLTVDGDVIDWRAATSIEDAKAKAEAINVRNVLRLVSTRSVDDVLEQAAQVVEAAGHLSYTTSHPELLDRQVAYSAANIRALKSRPTAPEPTPVLREESESEHIARDIREGRFPQQSPRQTVEVVPASVQDEAVQRLVEAVGDYIEYEEHMAHTDGGVGDIPQRFAGALFRLMAAHRAALAAMEGR